MKTIYLLVHGGEILGAFSSEDLLNNELEKMEERLRVDPKVTYLYRYNCYLTYWRSASHTDDVSKYYHLSCIKVPLDLENLNSFPKLEYLFK